MDIIYKIGDMFVDCSTGPFYKVKYYSKAEHQARKTLEYNFGVKEAILNSENYQFTPYMVMWGWGNNKEGVELMKREEDDGETITTRLIFRYITNKNWKQIDLIK